MSVLGQGKIPGHSGTEFKHRKAFQGRRFFSQRKLPQAGGSPVKARTEKSYTYQSWGVKVLQATLLILAIGAGIYAISNSDHVVNAQEHLSEIVEKESIRQSNAQQEAYQFLVRSAEAYYYSAELLAAQEEYELALRQIPDGRAALEGMTLTLLASCQAYAMMCEEAEDYLHAWPSEEQKRLLESVKAAFTQWEGKTLPTTRPGPLTFM